MTTDHETLRSYLLGQLPEEERMRLEERLLAEEDLFELAEATEAEILEEYFREDLAAESAQDLLGRLDASPAGRRRMALARARIAALRRHPSGRVLRFPPRIFSRPGVRAGLAAALVALSFGVWHWEHKTLPPIGISMQLDDTRSDGGSILPEVQPAPRQPVELRLGLKAGEPYASYDVSIREVGGGKVWGPRRYPAGSPLVVEAGDLPDGTYEVEVRGVRRDGGTENVGFPSFRVVRR